MPEVGPQVEEISAVTVYAKVALRWWPNEMHADDRWRRLDAVLRRITRENGTS